MGCGLLSSFWPFSQLVPSKPSAHRQNMCSPEVRERMEVPPLRQISPAEPKVDFTNSELMLTFSNHHERVLPERSGDEDQDEEDVEEEDEEEEKMKKFFCLLPPKMSWKKIVFLKKKKMKSLKLEWNIWVPTREKLSYSLSHRQNSQAVKHSHKCFRCHLPACLRRLRSKQHEGACMELFGMNALEVQVVASVACGGGGSAAIGWEKRGLVRRNSWVQGSVSDCCWYRLEKNRNFSYAESCLKKSCFYWIRLYLDDDKNCYLKSVHDCRHHKVKRYWSPLSSLWHWVTWSLEENLFEAIFITFFSS